MSHPDVTIYTVSTCSDCRATKAFLTEHEISFTEFDIEDQPEKAEELVNLTGKHIVPTIKIGEDVFIGFNVGNNRVPIEHLLLS